MEFFIHVSTQTTRIESALGHLTYIQDYQLIVQLVEYWHGVGHPSPLARLFAVQALMELCQMDRAWARLRELIESHPNWPDAHRTAAELFISRGWPKQARRPLQKAQLLEPGHPELLRLEALLRQQNLVDTEPPDTDALGTLMNQAKRLLRTGSKVKGAALLNQLQSRHPEDPSVKQLVWAHSGDFMLHDHSLWMHYAEKEHTYNATVSLNPPPTRRDPNNSSQIESDSAYNNRHINGLFLHSSDIDTEEIHPVDDATDSVELANLADLQRTSGVDFVRIGETIDVDTQIRRVFSKNTEPSNPSQHIHSNLPDQIEGFDLHAFRREMGMPSESESDYDPDPMETEDADRIVLVQHRQQTSTLTEDPTSEWLAPDPTTADKSADLLLVTDSNPENEPAVATTTQRKNRLRTTRRSWSFVPWLLTIVMLLALGVLSAILIIF